MVTSRGVISTDLKRPPLIRARRLDERNLSLSQYSQHIVIIDCPLIILDERLKEYPLAHSFVRSHGFGHYHRRHSFLENLWYEFKDDVELAFSEKPAIEQIREYYEAEETGWKEQKIMLTGYMQNLLRSLWTLIVYPSGWVYRYVNRRRSGIQKKTK